MRSEAAIIGVEIEQHIRACEPRLRDRGPDITVKAKDRALVQKQLRAAEAKIGRAIAAVRSGMFDDHAVECHLFDGAGDLHCVLCVLKNYVPHPSVDEGVCRQSLVLGLSDINIFGNGNHAEAFDSYLGYASGKAVLHDRTTRRIQE